MQGVQRKNHVDAGQQLLVDLQGTGPEVEGRSQNQVEGQGDHGWGAFAGNASQLANGQTTAGVSARGVLLGKALDPLGVPTRMFIGGEWVAPQGNRTLKVYDPATERLLYRCPNATKKDVEKAVQAARTAFDTTDWKKSGERRAQLLEAIAAKLRENSEEIATLEVRNTGK